jgi:hypothetical protein
MFTDPPVTHMNSIEAPIVPKTDDTVRKISKSENKPILQKHWEITMHDQVWDSNETRVDRTLPIHNYVGDNEG